MDFQIWCNSNTCYILEFIQGKGNFCVFDKRNKEFMREIKIYNSNFVWKKDVITVILLLLILFRQIFLQNYFLSDQKNVRVLLIFFNFAFLRGSTKN